MATSYPSPPQQQMFVYMDCDGYCVPSEQEQQQLQLQQAYLSHPPVPETEVLMWPQSSPAPLLLSPSPCRGSWYSWQAPYEMPTPPQSYPEADNYCDAKQMMINTSDEEEALAEEYQHPQSKYPSRPHECEFCSRSFSRRHDLDRHRRTHTGVKPYVCPCCLKAFPRSDARGRHFRSEPACRNGPQVLAFIKKSVRSTI
ncbi:hypothetical protein VTP01DRAFT_1141 [Rhizomucor pusillus]|uniref:uncharacterized protein n=1 Tax=Rhizomucor pusillus TaxID=4840 RepID=UPI003743B7B6